MNGSIRLFLDTPLGLGGTVSTSAAQAHYLATVMRRAVGDTVHLFNGRDGEGVAHIVTLRPDRAELTVERLLRVQAAEPDVWLLFALLKRDATDLVVQKATELGVSALHPIITERCNTHRMNANRLRAIAVEAAEQCERLTVPVLHDARSLPAVLNGWRSDRRLFVALERSDAPCVAPVPDPKALLVGPEGGFSSAELDAVRAHPFVTAVSLGPRVLRAETACIAGLALLQRGDCG